MEVAAVYQIRLIAHLAQREASCWGEGLKVSIAFWESAFPKYDISPPLKKLKVIGNSFLVLKHNTMLSIPSCQVTYYSRAMSLVLEENGSVILRAYCCCKYIYIFIEGKGVHVASGRYL